jgi:pimeloyl-ACP methyl ester carboxylesterase
MKNIYIFSGLGADKIVFQNMDFSNYNVTFVEWIVPIQNESIEQYAKRLTRQIVHKQPILIGLSFGGIMAVEVSKVIAVKKIILIASAKKRSEIPWYYKIAGKFRLYKIMPVVFMKRANFFSFWVFGIESENEQKILTKILKETDANFLRWAIMQITTWRNQIEPRNCIHIHGASDCILPIRFVKSCVRVEQGGHFMTLNKADLLTQIVRSELANTKR